MRAASSPVFCVLVQTARGDPMQAIDVMTNAAPSLQLHYRAFITITGCSAPVPRIGTPILAGGHAPSRSRANLRPQSRSASVIDRLLKNQNPLENRNNLRPSSPHLVEGKRPGTAPQFCGPKFMDTGTISVPITGVRFGNSTTRRRGARRLAWRKMDSSFKLRAKIGNALRHRR